MNYKIRPLEHQISMLYISRVMYNDRISMEQFIQEIHKRVDEWAYGDERNDTVRDAIDDTASGSSLPNR